MAVWMRDNGKFYLPPSKPTARVLSTDEYVTETNIFFQAATERLITVGHPFFPVRDEGTQSVVVPKVSAHQFRVFRLLCPDPNKFALIDPSIYNRDRERLVWKLKGIEVDRGNPLGVGCSGHPYFNKYSDVENPTLYPEKDENDHRLNVAFDPKQNQVFIVGCTPPWGEYWDVTESCPDRPLKPGDCPPIERKTTVIQDGDMSDIGFGAINNRTFFADRSGVPLDILNDITKWPDFIKMSKDISGDSMFFFGRKEQLYARHMFTRAGNVGDAIPMESTDYLLRKADNQIASHIYYSTPSGSLNSTEGQMFNKPFWLQRAQGTNNGICWGNQLFVTVLDNTHNTNFTLSVKGADQPEVNVNYTYKSTDFRQFLRHTEIYDIEIVMQLCKVSLDPDVLAHINVMNPTVLDDWDLAFVPPPPQGVEDTYRYLSSWATKCPTADTNTEKVDPYEKYNFWKVDLTEKFTSELSQTSLGRRFLYQTGVLGRKRIRTDITSPKVSRKTAKRKRSK